MWSSSSCGNLWWKGESRSFQMWCRCLMNILSTGARARRRAGAGRGAGATCSLASSPSGRSASMATSTWWVAKLGRAWLGSLTALGLCDPNVIVQDFWNTELIAARFALQIYIMIRSCPNYERLHYGEAWKINAKLSTQSNLTKCSICKHWLEIRNGNCLVVTN